MIPGLGTSVRPQLLDESYIDEVIRVEEPDAVRVCRRLAARGFLFGGSTGTVISGATQWLARHDGRDLTAVAIAPDLGERYLDTVYQPGWLEELQHDKDMRDRDMAVLASDELAVLSRPALTGGNDRGLISSMV